jgi:hypothetical protein
MYKNFHIDHAIPLVGCSTPVGKAQIIEHYALPSNFVLMILKIGFVRLPAAICLSRGLRLTLRLPRQRRRPYSNVTPIRFSFRHTTRQDMWRPSGDRIRVKCSGIPTELVTLSIAPVFDKLRTMQLMEPLPIKMVPALSTLWRGAARFSCSDDGMGAFPHEAGAQHSPVTDRCRKETAVMNATMRLPDRE